MELPTSNVLRRSRAACLSCSGDNCNILLLLVEVVCEINLNLDHITIGRFQIGDISSERCVIF